MLTIKTKVLGKKGLGKLRRLDNFLTKNVGPNSLHGIVDSLGHQIWENVLARYDSQLQSSTQVISLLQQQKNTSTAQADGSGRFEFIIGDSDSLEQNTIVASVGTGATYSKWHLLEYGWGLRGGSRQDEYTIWYKGHFGVSPTFVEQDAESGLISGELIPVKHPGYSGVFGFLTKAGALHTADLELVPKSLINIAKVINRISRQ